MANIVYTTATIANAATTSGVIDCTNGTLSSFYIPAAFTGTAITFTASDEPNGTFGPIKDSAGAARTWVVAANDRHDVNPANFAGHRWIKIVSGSAEGAARDIKIGLRQYV